MRSICPNEDYYKRPDRRASWLSVFWNQATANNHARRHGGDVKMSNDRQFLPRTVETFHDYVPQAQVPLLSRTLRTVVVVCLISLV